MNMRFMDWLLQELEEVEETKERLAKGHILDDTYRTELRAYRTMLKIVIKKYNDFNR